MVLHSLDDLIASSTTDYNFVIMTTAIRLFLKIKFGLQFEIRLFKLNILVSQIYLQSQ